LGRRERKTRVQTRGKTLGELVEHPEPGSEQGLSGRILTRGASGSWPAKIEAYPGQLDPLDSRAAFVEG